MWGVKIILRGLDRKLRRFADEMERRQYIAFQTVAWEVEASAKERAPANRGKLGQSIRGIARRSGKDVWAEVGTNIKHAQYTELGNTPVGGGPITPKRAKVLRFQVRDASGRRWISKKAVAPIAVGTAEAPTRVWQAKTARAGRMQTMPWLRRAAFIKRARIMSLIGTAANKALVEAAKH